MTNSADEELVASKTEGFKVAEKKTLEEYAKLGERIPPESYGQCLIPSTSKKNLDPTIFHLTVFNI